MKIAVVGCGAVGTYYGAKLLRAGGDVSFLLRSDYEAVRSRGVSIRSPDGDFQVHPKPARVPAEIGVCDLVVIALKTTANHVLPELLGPLIGPSTLRLTLQNGLGNEERLAALHGPERILGGLCFVCLNRVQPGVIHHLAHGRVTIGEHLRKPGRHARETAALFQQAGVPCDVAEDLEAAHWAKLVWNIPFNGLGVAGTAGYEAVLSGHCSTGKPLAPVMTTDQLLGQPRWETLVRQLMREVITAAHARGSRLAPRLTDELVEQTRVMGAYKASTLVDYERGQPLELESLFLRPLALAQASGVETPRLAALCSVLRELDQGWTPAV